MEKTERYFVIGGGGKTGRHFDIENREETETLCYRGLAGERETIWYRELGEERGKLCCNVSRIIQLVLLTAETLLQNV
jgi:hypothetical protein